MKLTVRYRNATHSIRDRYAKYVVIPEYFDYTGEVLPNPKWVKDDSFCLSSGPGKLDFRVLLKENIIHGWLHS
jgi:hypothetical protein